MTRFADIFHHRLLMMFYRAWAGGQPTVNHDDPASDRFVLYAGALVGLGLPSLQNRDDFPDAAKLFYAGRLSSQSKNADGLEAMIGDFFRMPTRIQGFVGDWLTGCPLEPASRSPPPKGAQVDSGRPFVDSGLAPEAWWLATTSRWRTTPALHRSPTKPVLCSRIREHLKRPLRTLSSALLLKRERPAA